MQRTISRQWTAAIAFVMMGALLLVAADPVAAADMGYRGELGYGLTYALSSGEVAEQRVRFGLKMDAWPPFDGKVHIGLAGDYDVQEGQGRVDIGEAYVDLYLAAADVRLGRQVVSWGTADGFNPTNVINPPGPLSLSFDAPSRAPVPAVHAAYYLPSGSSITGVFIADFVAAEHAVDVLQQMAAAFPTTPGGPPVQLTPPPAVPADGGQFGYALRAETFLGNHNMYATYYNGWEPHPAAWVTTENIPFDPFVVPTGIRTAYRKKQAFGLATAGTWGSAGVWSEVAYTAPEKLAVLEGPFALSSNAPYWEAVVGADYMLPSGVMLTGQLVHNGSGTLLHPYAMPGQSRKARTYFTGAALYSPQFGHDVEFIGLTDLHDRGAIAVVRYKYDITQGIRLTVALSHAFGPDQSEFVQLKEMADGVNVGVTVNF